MAIIYNDTELTSLTYNGTELSEVWVCDTSTTCCTLVYKSYDYGVLDVELKYLSDCSYLALTPKDDVALTFLNDGYPRTVNLLSVNAGSPASFTFDEDELVVGQQTSTLISCAPDVNKIRYGSTCEYNFIFCKRTSNFAYVYTEAAIAQIPVESGGTLVCTTMYVYPTESSCICGNFITCESEGPLFQLNLTDSHLCSNISSLSCLLVNDSLVNEAYTFATWNGNVLVSDDWYLTCPGNINGIWCYHVPIYTIYKCGDSYGIFQALGSTGTIISPYAIATFPPEDIINNFNYIKSCYEAGTCGIYICKWNQS